MKKPGKYQTKKERADLGTETSTEKSFVVLLEESHLLHSPVSSVILASVLK